MIKNNSFIVSERAFKSAAERMGEFFPELSHSQKIEKLAKLFGASSYSDFKNKFDEKNRATTSKLSNKSKGGVLEQEGSVVLFTKSDIMSLFVSRTLGEYGLVITVEKDLNKVMNLSSSILIMDESFLHSVAAFNTKDQQNFNAKKKIILSSDKVRLDDPSGRTIILQKPIDKRDLISALKGFGVNFIDKNDLFDALVSKIEMATKCSIDLSLVIFNQGSSLFQKHVKTHVSKMDTVIPMGNHLALIVWDRSLDNTENMIIDIRNSWQNDCSYSITPWNNSDPVDEFLKTAFASLKTK